MKRAYKYRANIIVNGEKRDTLQLSQGILYAPNIENLNDPFEGSVELPKSYKYEQWVTPLVQRLYSSGIYSLSKPQINETFPCNELLWAHYANSHKGFCIEYDLDKLSNNISCDFDITNVINVTYKSNRPKVFNNEDVFLTQQKVFGTKSMVWEYENEVRLIFKKSGEKIVPKDAITAIYFGLRIGLEDRNEIIKQMHGRNINFYQIERNGNSYQLKATKLSFEYSYEIINVEHLSTIDNYMVLYKSSNKDKNTLIDFIHYIRQDLKRPTNITVIDDIKAMPILMNYKPRQLMTDEEIEIQAEHWIAYSTFDAPECVMIYPEKL